MYKENPQMSESLPVGILLALSGGMMDAYSYIGRGHVFANAQTGNILLLGISLSQGQWGECLRYVCPVAAFIAGIALSNVVRIGTDSRGCTGGRLSFWWKPSSWSPPLFCRRA